MTELTRTEQTSREEPEQLPDLPANESGSLPTEVAQPVHRPSSPKRSRRSSNRKPVSQIETADVAVLSTGLTTDANATPVQEKAPRTGISYEVAAYLLLIVAAILTRFWDLGAKALHHDESLHAYYSWVFETGGGYRHHPLMHGPFLFHANALVYLLFGDSDASSRYLPAFFGVVLVGLPYLLRGQHLLGRWGALATSFLFLISPVLLYQSRYIRHDIYTIVGTLVLFIAIVRYWEMPQRRWLVIGAGSIAFLLTNHEIVFAILVIFGGFLYGALAISRFRAWWPERRDIIYQLLGLHLGLVVALLAMVALMPTSYKDRIYDIPWENPTTQEQIDYYKDLLSNPLVLGGVAVLVSFVLGMWMVLSSARDPEKKQEGWLPALFGNPEERTVEYGLVKAGADRTGLLIAAGIFVFIFATFFTTLYTNLYGLVSSTIATDGTLLYWLGQHDYRRGEQPWFYFLLLMPQYEFIAVLFGSAMAIITGVRAVGSLFGWLPVGRNFFFRFMTTVWFAGIFVGLSYAGEKMPWLVSHITLPATILAGALIGGLIERTIAAREARLVGGRSAPRAFAWPEWSLALLLIGLTGCWYVLAGRLSFGRFEETGRNGNWTRTLTSYAADRWWWLAIPPLVAAIAIAIATIVRGSRRSAISTLGAVTVILTLLQIHTGWVLSYENPDVPTEMMIYTQTSPDVTRVMDEITELSFELTGGYGMEVWYDSGVSWPFQWYLRDFPNKRFVGSQIAGPPDDAPIVIVSTQYESSFEPYLSGYTATEYVLRWWFPEDLYRNFAIAPELPVGRSAWKSADEAHGLSAVVESIAESFGNQLSPEDQARLYRLMLYRDLEQPLGQYNFKVYVRNDLLPLLNSIRY